MSIPETAEKEILLIVRSFTDLSTVPHGYNDKYTDLGKNTDIKNKGLMQMMQQSLVCNLLESEMQENYPYFTNG